MECPASPSVASELEDLASKLHSLKTLYTALLQINKNLMDEKSRHFLKELLDDATRQALQSQGKKIISCMPEMPKSLAKSIPSPFSSVILQNELQQASNDVRQCSTPITVPCENSVMNVQRLPETFPVVSKPGISLNSCPVCDPLPPDRPSSKDATISDIGSSHRAIVGRRSGSMSTRKSSWPSNKVFYCSEPSIKGNSSLTSAENRNNHLPILVKGGEVLALVPAQKGIGVSPPDLVGWDACRTLRIGCVGQELTDYYQKKVSSRTTNPQMQRRMGSSKDKYQRHKRFTLARDRTSDSQQRNQSTRYPLTPLKARRYSSESTSKTSRSKQLSSESQIKLNHTSSNSPGYRRTRNIKAAQTKPVIKPEKALLQQVLKNRALLVSIREPPSLRKKNEVGRLRRFKNKLAIIFHHHHHHHLHQSEDVGKKRHERFFRKYLMMAMCHNSVSGEKEERKKEAARRRYHKNLLVFVESIIHLLQRLLWRKNANRRQRMGKIATRRKGSKKLHWWQCFKRRGGLWLGRHRRRQQLTLGFNKSRRRISTL